MIQEFIAEICDILNIPEPSVSFDTSNFPTNTMMAQCSPFGDIIHLKKYDKPNPDQLFAIAHELRHIWQMQNDEQFYFSTYKPVDLCISVESYNLQIAEIDANAFTGIIMVEFFHLQPLYKGLSDSVKAKIHERMKEIASIL